MEKGSISGLCYKTNWMIEEIIQGNWYKTVGSLN